MAIYEPIEYSIRQCELYLENHGRYLDPYARDLFNWLTAEARRLQEQVETECTTPR